MLSKSLVTIYHTTTVWLGPGASISGNAANLVLFLLVLHARQDSHAKCGQL